MSEKWKPSPREEHFLWYLRLVTRYGVGVGGLIWAIVTNHLSPVLLMVLGALATATDVAMVVRDLIIAAKQERAMIELEQAKRYPLPTSDDDSRP